MMTPRMPPLCIDRASLETIKGKYEADVVEIGTSRMTFRNVTCVSPSGRGPCDQPLQIARMRICRRGL